MDLHAASQDLLETLANSIHDRDTLATACFSFYSDDILVAQKWLSDFLKEARKGWVQEPKRNYTSL